MARVIASLGNYIYSIGNDGLWVHLFAGNQSDIEIAGQKVQISEETLYPWDGTVKLTLNPQQPTRFTIYLRVPGWCLNYTVAINGETVNCQPEMSGYLALTRQWKAGDMIDYTMDMPVQAIFANPAVRQLQGRVAIQRGPIIYCIEGIDHNQMILDRISINPTDIASFTAKYRPDLCRRASGCSPWW